MGCETELVAVGVGHYYPSDPKLLDVASCHLARLIEMGLKIITGSDSSWGHYKLGKTVYETECLVQAGTRCWLLWLVGRPYCVLDLGSTLLGGDHLFSVPITATARGFPGDGSTGKAWPRHRRSQRSLPTSQIAQGSGRDRSAGGHRSSAGLKRDAPRIW